MYVVKIPKVIFHFFSTWYLLNLIFYTVGANTVNYFYKKNSPLHICPAGPFPQLIPLS